MATCAQTIKLAMRKLQLLAAGKNPSATEGADYLEVLQDLYLTWVEKGRFGVLAEVIADAAYEAGENERIVSNGYTITYPSTVIDPATNEARKPLDLSIVVKVTAGAEPVIKTYDAYRGEWVELTNLTMGGLAPLSGRGNDGLASCLAVQIADENGSPIPEAVAVSQRAFLGRLSSRKATERQTVPVEYF